MEQNPVTAGLVSHAEDWNWSSACSHIAGQWLKDDPLTDVAALGASGVNWPTMLRYGVEVGDLDADGEAVVKPVFAPGGRWLRRTGSHGRRLKLAGGLYRESRGRNQGAMVK